MADISIFRDKKITPSDKDLLEKLGATFDLWKQIQNFVLIKYPKGIPEWNYPGEKYGWSFRIKDKKRAIIYFLPRDKYFKVAFVFGQKATDYVLSSNISADIKIALEKATKYAEGRGIRIDVNDETIISDVKNLVTIKLDN
ncbi:MAG: DUF3788 domain-containing protein [Saprospiraceae bacterium]|nr:DUF3788 domain-containing protein [Saprospiraceae bacterium]